MDIPDVWYLLVNSSQMQAACKQQYKYTIRGACAESINNALITITQCTCISIRLPSLGDCSKYEVDLSAKFTSNYAYTS